ncbi:uncharacterized protein LOC134654745 [Cydia amplana]|uniref:uncharacterized protein LOC134654745 n=1 Tax=Cydia amplana TaxID=1869771 RepID=UPI002FE536B4
MRLDSILSILLSCYYSKKYVKFLTCLNANDILVDFQNDKIYFKLYYPLRNGEERIITLARVLSIMRLHVECNFIYYIFHTVSEQLQCIMRSVVRSKLFYNENSDQMINLEKWRQYYTNVKKSTELFNEMYGIQVHLILFYWFMLIFYQKKLRAVKRLLRVVSSRPIKVKTFGGIDINMTLVPACFTFVASYTVILLQFNNVV